MKTLKQLREEYNGKFMSQVEVLPEEVLLEKNVIPSTKEMPSLLIFRRVSFRSYPKGQVVALYYSKTMDKYLSVPIGPGNSVNLSESVVSDSLDEACWKGYKQYGMKKKGGKEVPNCVPVEEDGPVMSRYTERPTYEHFKNKVGKLREERNEQLDEMLPAIIGAGLRLASTAAGRQVLKRGAKMLAKKALKGAGKALFGDKDDDKKSSSEKGDFDSASMRSSSEKPQGMAKTSSSWENRSGSDPVYQSKVKQASLAPVKENTISDIRTMIKEGIDNMDLSINGRTITLNTSMAKRILEVYDSVNTKNKKIVEGMLNEDLESFKKLINFSIRN
jgi:hypothetical protein